MLEEEVPSIPVPEETSPLLLASLGIALDLVPVASERVDDLALDVCHDLGSRWGNASKDLCVA